MLGAFVHSLQLLLMELSVAGITGTVGSEDFSLTKIAFKMLSPEMGCL
jgi:hypothetical protein